MKFDKGMLKKNYGKVYLDSILITVEKQLELIRQ